MSNTTVGREPIQLVQIDQDFCGEVYGVSPCTAAIGVTGAIKCFNTLSTCQDEPNYNRQTLTLTFGKAADALPKDEYIIPSLVSVSSSPTILNAGGGSSNSGPLGVRSSVTVIFTDHPHSDRLVDKYRTERGYIATDRSTFWAKWLARNPYHQNRTIRVLDGYKGQSIASMQSRTYIIESVSGPDASGRVTIKGKDILKLADDKRALAPRLSTGELIVDIDETATTLRVTGAQAADYPAPGVVRIGDEIITYAGVSTIIADQEINITGCVRGTNGTTAEAHSAEDRVQLCLQYTDDALSDIAYDLLVNYGNVPSGYINKTAWDLENSVWLAQFNMSAIISEPVGVTKLLGEITEQGMFYIWWDERSQEVNFDAIKPVETANKTLNDDSHILADSTAITVKPDERISQVWVFWNPISPTADLEEDKNYRAVRIRANLENEAAERYGDQRIKKIYSRWLQNSAQAINISSRLLSRYSDAQKYLDLTLDAKDRALWTGDIADVTHYNIVDETGLPVAQRWQVIEADEADSGHVVRYKLQRYEYLITDIFGYWMASDAPVYTLASDAEKLRGAWWSDENGKMSDGSDGAKWQ